MKLNPTLLESILAFLLSLSVYLWVKHGKRITRWWKERHIRHRRPRRLRPREPADSVCNRCTLAAQTSPAGSHSLVTGQKPTRAKETGRYQWVCLLESVVAHFGIADPTIHALVSNGRRGINQDILYFKCQACGWAEPVISPFLADSGY